MGMCFGYTGVIMKLIKFHSNGNKEVKIDVFKLKNFRVLEEHEIFILYKPT